jgi:hypothetical protein
MSHPDSRVLAEFRAGLIDGRRGARISAHLVTCEHCADLCDKLAEVSVLLAAAPAPVMPERVARRLDGVLAAEAAQRDNSERAGDPRPPGRVAGSRATGTGALGPDRHRNFRLVALRVLAPAAAAALLAAGGYGLTRIGGGSSTFSSTAAKPAVAGPNASAVPSAASASHAEAVPEREAQAQASLQVVISRTDYRRATLRQQLEQTLQLHARGAAGRQQAAPPSVKACVLRVTGGISPGMLVEEARFQGQPATVIIAVSGHHRVAWVAGDACSFTDEDLLATTTLPGTSAA